MPATNKKRRQGEESRERLLQAAVELVSTGGYAGTGVDAISRRARVVKSALYWHFGSKEKLLASALEQTAADWLDEATDRLALITGMVDERVARLVEELQQFFLHKPQSLQLLLLTLVERGDTSPELREVVSSIFAQLRDTLARTLEGASVGPARARGTAHLLMALMQGLFLDARAEPGAPTLERRLEMVRQAVLLSLEPEPRPPSGPRLANA